MATCCGRPPDSGQNTNSIDDSISLTFTELVVARLNSSYDGKTNGTLQIPVRINGIHNTVWPSWCKAADSSLHAYNELTNEIAVDLLDMPLKTFLDLDTLASKLTDTLKECANITILSGSFNPNTKPYWSDQACIHQTDNAEFDSDFKDYVTGFVDRTIESCAKYNGLLPGGK
ncbi:Hypothetical predicted protein [Mytilus galloprovincialis]|uniref:Uncharacterized protein n=1 Tax=Mytilus galloprovincialis TaxID=29158 RepID=A0A8B6EHX9_MYTGA|nr:Hypothetical predicted protein [Mytilus galloprovincialis]